MLQKLTQPYFIMGIVGAIKMMLQVFGIQIPDADLNNFFNGIAALVTIIGIIKDHGQQAVVQPVPPESKPQIPSAP